jgi:hypothetical protein
MLQFVEGMQNVSQTQWPTHVGGYGHTLPIIKICITRTKEHI